MLVTIQKDFSGKNIFKGSLAAHKFQDFILRLLGSRKRVRTHYSNVVKDINDGRRRLLFIIKWAMPIADFIFLFGQILCLVAVSSINPVLGSYSDPIDIFQRVVCRCNTLWSFYR